MGVKENHEEIIKRTGNAAKIVAVIKGVDVKKVKEAYDSGIKHFGESKVQEAEEKIEKLKGMSKAKWHMIGHLQSTKVKKAVELFDVIQSVDSVHLAELIGKQAVSQKKIMDISLQVNIGMEPQKYGVNAHEAMDILKSLLNIEGIKVRGLMAITPNVEPEQRRECFKQMRQLFNQAKAISPDVEHLSMGMSDDYEIAVQEGSTMIRIGTALFGQRESD